MASYPVARPLIRNRSRPLYATLATLTIGAGLASRRYPDLMPQFVARYAGDTLWATLVFWLLALIWRRAPKLSLAFGSLALAVGVEFSQLYHSAWIDTIRQTRLGALVLGSGFLWSDLACYAVGVGIAVWVDLLLLRTDGTPPASVAAG